MPFSVTSPHCGPCALYDGLRVADKRMREIILGGLRIPGQTPIPCAILAASREATLKAADEFPQVATGMRPIAIARLTRIAEKIQPTVLLSTSAYSPSHRPKRRGHTRPVSAVPSKAAAVRSANSQRGISSRRFMPIQRRRRHSVSS